jgi:hypothetical protein
VRCGTYDDRIRVRPVAGQRVAGGANHSGAQYSLARLFPSEMGVRDVEREGKGR